MKPLILGMDPFQTEVIVQKLGADKPEGTTDFPSHDAPIVCWSQDGKKLVVSTMTAREPDVAFENVLLDPATNKTVIGRGSYMAFVRGGKVVEFRSHPDAAGIMMQLGLVPAM